MTGSGYSSKKKGMKTVSWNLHAVKLNTNMCTSGSDVTPSWLGVVSKFLCSVCILQDTLTCRILLYFIEPGQTNGWKQVSFKTVWTAIIKALYNIYTVVIKPMKSTVAFVCTESQCFSNYITNIKFSTYLLSNCPRRGNVKCSVISHRELEGIQVAGQVGANATFVVSFIDVLSESRFVQKTQ